MFRYIVEHMDTVLKMGVRGIARENFTSASTIMRLTKNPGYDGFVDMYCKLLPLVNKVQEKIQYQLWRMPPSGIRQSFFMRSGV